MTPGESTVWILLLAAVSFLVTSGPPDAFWRMLVVVVVGSYMAGYMSGYGKAMEDNPPDTED